MPQSTLTRAADLVARVAGLLDAAGPGQRVLLGLVGEPGGGKSTVSEALVLGLAERGVGSVVVPMDGFHLANAELARLGLADRKGAIATFDAAGYLALLQRLRGPLGPDSPVVYAPYFDRAIEESVGSAIPVPPDVPVVITEGNYLLSDEPVWRDVRGLLDECWYVDVDQQLRLERLVARHVRYGRSEDAARAWVMRSDEANAVVVRATRERADVLVALP